MITRAELVNKKKPLLGGTLAFLFFYFVSTEILLGFGEDNVLSENRVVFTKGEFVGSIHRVLFRVILTNSGFFRDKTDELALCIIFLSHN